MFLTKFGKCREVTSKILPNRKQPIPFAAISQHKNAAARLLSAESL